MKKTLGVFFILSCIYIVGGVLLLINHNKKDERFESFVKFTKLMNEIEVNSTFYKIDGEKNIYLNTKEYEIYLQSDEEQKKKIILEKERLNEISELRY